jgi:hypothetical protein
MRLLAKIMHFKRLMATNIQQPGYGMDDKGIRVTVQSGSGAHTASFPVGARDSFPGRKQLQHEADSSSFSAKVKNVWNFIATSHISSWHCLIKQRENFAFYKVERECISFQNYNIRRMYRGIPGNLLRNSIW